MASKNKVDMLSGPLLGKIIVFAIPIEVLRSFEGHKEQATDVVKKIIEK